MILNLIKRIITKEDNEVPSWLNQPHCEEKK